MRTAGFIAVASYAILCASGWLWGTFPLSLRVALYLTVLLGATTAGLIGWRGAAHASEADVRRVTIFALVAAVFAAATPPLVVQDFWYYLAVGRFAESGGRAYHEFLPASVMSAYGVDGYTKVIWPYGPAWLWLVRLVTALGGERQWLEFVLLKGVLLAAWACLLALLASASAPPAIRARAVIVAGWWPIGIWQALVEGHNDVLMVLGVTLWLVRPAHVWAVPASLLAKYASAPLVAVGALDAWRQGGRRRWVYAAAVAVAAAVLLLSWRGGDPLQGIRANTNLRVLSVAAGLDRLERLFGWPSWITTVTFGVWRAALVTLMAWYGVQYLRGHVTRAAVVSAIWIAILFGATNTPPWYGLWLVPSLILSGDRRLLALAAPWLLIVPFVHVRAVAPLMSAPNTFLALWLCITAGWGLILLRSRWPERRFALVR